MPLSPTILTSYRQATPCSATYTLRNILPCVAPSFYHNPPPVLTPLPSFYNSHLHPPFHIFILILLRYPSPFKPSNNTPPIRPPVSPFTHPLLSNISPLPLITHPPISFPIPQPASLLPPPPTQIPRFSPPLAAPVFTFPPPLAQQLSPPPVPFSSLRRIPPPTVPSAIPQPPLASNVSATLRLTSTEQILQSHQPAMAPAKSDIQLQESNIQQDSMSTVHRCGRCRRCLRVADLDCDRGGVLRKSCHNCLVYFLTPI